MSTRITLPRIALALAITWPSALSSRAQAPGSGTEQRLESLERRVLELEQRLKELTPSGGASSVPPSKRLIFTEPAPQPEPPARPEPVVAAKVQPGMKAKIYVRKDEKEASESPAAGDRVSEEVFVADSKYDASAVAGQGGYKDHPVTIVWTGLLKVTQEDIYEFLLDEKAIRSVNDRYGNFYVTVPSVTLGSPKSMDKVVAVKLEPGYWPISVRTMYYPKRRNQTVPSFTVKQKGKVALEMGPGNFWSETK
jgi:hypothetical protein